MSNLSRPARVLFLGLSTFGSVGGLQNFNRRQIANLNDLDNAGALGGVRVHLLDDVDSELPARLNGVAFGKGRLRFVLQTLAQAHRYDVVLLGHINLLPIAWLAKRLNPSLRLVLFVHGDEVWNGPARSVKPYDPWMLKSVDRIASVSLYTARVMAGQFRVDPSRFVLFPNAVDPLPQRQVTEREPERQAVDTVLAVSRIGLGDRRKNIDLLIRAIGVLKLQGRAGRLEIVGDGALRAELEALAEAEGVTDRVRFLGRIDDDALDAAYRRAAVFALPSSKEGFGIVYLEAWMRGLPVICGRLGAAHEVVSDGIDGRVVDETSPEQTAEAIHSLISDPLLSAVMGAAGKAKVNAQYLNVSAQRNLALLLGIPG